MSKIVIFLFKSQVRFKEPLVFTLKTNKEKNDKNKGGSKFSNSAQVNKQLQWKLDGEKMSVNLDKKSL